MLVLVNKVNRYYMKILGFLLIFSVIPAYSTLEDLDDNDVAQVKVRAVFIDCDINEKQMPLGTDSLRFQREELFKHSALRDCKKKLALTVKMTSHPVVNRPVDDEYIPIEHVFDVSNKRRVRLLNPYVLRLRRDPPLESYRLHEIDTFNGLLVTSNENIQLHESDTKRERNKRKINTRDESYTTTQDIVQMQMCPKVIVNTSTWTVQRKKRFNIKMEMQQDNDIFDESIPRWLKEDFDGQQFSDHEIGKGAARSAKGELKSDKMKEWSKYNTGPQGEVIYTILKDGTNILNDQTVIDSVNINSNEIREKANPSVKEKHAANTPSNSNVSGNLKSEFDRIRTHNFRRQLDNTDKEFGLYEIGNPEIWFRAQVQLLEKLSTPEGKTVWRDITQQKLASITSNDPEWRNQDLHIRYRCTEWVPKEDYTLPSTGFVLLLARDKEIVNGLSKHKFGEYLIVPYEDIEAEKDEELKKREDSSIRNISPPSEARHNRRAVVRMSRALFVGNEDHIMIINEGPDKYLSLPFKQPHHAQIDLEARADENQLIYVGSSGRITTAVSENTRRSRTALTVQVTNTGLAAARFRPKIRDCAPEIMRRDSGDEVGISVDPVLIPPMHSRTFRFEVPVEGLEDSARCSVVLLNDADESVAIREVRIKRGDRCFCVWHCQCVCLNEDPKLECQEMAEYQQIVAGLAPRERPRQVRAACFENVITINLMIVIMGVPLVLLALGLLKAILGLCLRCVASWGINCMIQTPRKLDHYYEPSLRSRDVVFDQEGWPVHPDTKKRTVRLISKPMEFMLNIIMFIALPCISVWRCLEKFVAQCNKDISEEENANNPDARNFPNKMNSYENIQAKKVRGRWGRPHRIKRLYRWMTGPAEDLASDLWQKGMAPQDNTEPDNMRPLLKNECYPVKSRDVHASIVDSEHDDTEYVLLQMQKSKDSLSKTQSHCK